jgi:hypothetical protein
VIAQRVKNISNAGKPNLRTADGLAHLMRPVFNFISSERYSGGALNALTPEVLWHNCGAPRPAGSDFGVEDG